MKVFPFYMIFVAISYAAWYGADLCCSKWERDLTILRVPQDDLVAAQKTALSKATQILTYAKKKPNGDPLVAARAITAADFDGSRFTAEQLKKDFDVIPARINRMVEEEKLSGIASFSFGGSGASTKVEINDLRGSPVSILRLLRTIDQSIPELRFSKALWEATEGVPAVRIEYDVWNPNIGELN